MFIYSIVDIYSGHALACSHVSIKLSYFAGLPLKQKKQVFQINVT